MNQQVNKRERKISAGSFTEPSYETSALYCSPSEDRSYSETRQIQRKLIQLQRSGREERRHTKKG